MNQEDIRLAQAVSETEPAGLPDDPVVLAVVRNPFMRADEQILDGTPDTAVLNGVGAVLPYMLAQHALRRNR